MPFFVKLNFYVFKTKIMIRAVIFDMDGLLVDSEPFWAQAELEVFPQYGIDLTLEDCQKMQGVSIREVVRYWYEKRPWQGASVEQVARQITQRVIELILERGRLMPGVVEVLEFFRKKQIPMAVASSSEPHLIKLVLERFDIEKYFEFYHSARAEKHGKPYPDVFLTTAKRLQVQPQQCLVFEDSYNGVLAARRAGMKVVAVPYPQNFDDPRFDIADLKLRSLKDWNEDLWQKLNNLS